MAIPYVKVKRSINVGMEPGEKFLIKIFKEEPVDLDVIAEEIAESSTMSKGDVMGVLQQLQVRLSFHLMRGASVRLSLLGTFSPTIRAKAVPTMDELTVDTIKGVHVSFRPSPWLSNKIKGVKFKQKDLSVKGLQVSQPIETRQVDVKTGIDEVAHEDAEILEQTDSEQNE